MLNKVGIGRRAEKISFLLNFSGSHDWTASLPLDTAHLDKNTDVKSFRTKIIFSREKWNKGIILETSKLYKMKRLIIEVLL